MADFDFSTLITDRTQADLDALRALLSTPMADWTAEQLAEFNLAVSKGAYNYTDLNRVTACMDYLNEVLTGLGYVTGYAPVYILHLDGTTDTVWRENDEDIRADRIEACRANVACIRGAFAQLAATPQTPADLELLTWAEANDIERILMAVEDGLRRMTQSRWYSGEIYSGEVTA